jgi:hypothetical protein
MSSRSVWRTAAILSLVMNAILAGAIVWRWGGQTTTVRGELFVPLLDLEPAFDAKARNTQLIQIKTDSGEYRSCRIPTAAYLLAVSRSLEVSRGRTGERSAIVEAEILDTNLGPRCTALTTITEGLVLTPK